MKPTKCPAKKERGKKSKKRGQGCALAEPRGLWCLTFVLGRLENLCFFIEIIFWSHWFSQVQSTGLPSIFLRAQPWRGGEKVESNLKSQHHCHF